MKKKLPPEVEAAIASLYDGEPLGKVISQLRVINRAAIIESYRSGLTSRQCEQLHGVGFGEVCRVIARYAPELLRPVGRDGWTKNLIAKAEGREPQ